MLSLFIALAATTAQTPATAAPAATAPAARSLASVPGVTIRYYDVTGKDMKSINRSIARQRGTDPATKQPLTGGTNWTVSPSFNKRTENDVCTITSVDTAFTATADLPRLTTEELVDTQVRTAWRTFVANLEAAAAAKLWFAYDRLGTIKSAMLNKPCDQAIADGTAAVAKLKADAAAYQPPVAAAR